MRAWWLLVLSVLAPALALAAPPSFARDVAPILRARCVSCHRPGQIGPMSLMTYAQARPWAKSIRDEVLARAMPPWRADPTIGSFANDPRLSPRELKTIVDWAEGGAPEGQPRGVVARPAVESEWLIGKPDAVLPMPTEFVVPARGDLDL